MKKVIVITGGSDGLGKETAAQLGVHHTVVILSPNREKLAAAAKEIGCEYEVCDVADATQVAATFQSILLTHGRIDCLINNAGAWIEGELDENAPDTIAHVVGVNTLGPIYATRAVIPAMKQQGHGLIINVITQSGLYAKPKRSVYIASKWAITGFTKSIQSELAPYGIRVSGIYPGKMNTPMFGKLGITKDMSDALEKSEVAKAIAFLVETPNHVMIPEFGIKHINN